MNREKGKIYLAVPIVVLAIILVYYFMNFRIGSALHPEKTAHNMAELNTLAMEKIDSGAKEADFYVTGISEDDLMNINENLCSMNGMVDQYSVTEKSHDGMRIKLKFEISDNYYVYEKFKHGTEIPGDRPLAIKLYDKIEGILNHIIEPGMSDYEKELAIHDYIVSHCKYGYVDTSKDYAYRAYGALVQNTAVCNGYAEAMALLMSCVDIENQIITGTADNELHAWNLVNLDGEWYQVDATWDDPLPDRGTNVRHQYFNITDELMDERHDWKQDTFPECNSTVYNYFVKNDLICDHAGFEKIVRNKAARSITGTVEAWMDDFDMDEDFKFMNTIPGLQYFSYNEERFGNRTMVTIYLNQRD